MRLSDSLKYLTVPIQTADTAAGRWTGSGTGFFFAFDQGDKKIPLLITNKHVLSGAAQIGLILHQAGTDGGPKGGMGKKVSFLAGALPVFMHPEPSVDIAAIAAGPILNQLEAEGDAAFLQWVAPENIPSARQWREFGTLEDVIMPGYPVGLADQHNNLPIIRRGLTATPCGSHYQGRAEFLVDMAVFPGSSGLPVMIVNEGSFATSEGLVVGTRFYLLGILYGGHCQTTAGKVVSIPAPTTAQQVAEIKQMVHLGVCVKSQRLLDLEALLPAG